MKVTFKHEKKSVAIEIPQASLEDKLALFGKAFEFLGVPPSVVFEVPDVTDKDVQRLKENLDAYHAAPSNVLTDKGREIVKKVLEERKSRPKTLPLVGASEPTLMVNLGEQFGDKLMQALPQAEPTPDEPTPEHWETGIQYKDFDGVQVPCYRTYYYCPNGHRGKRYIPEGRADYVHCHTCNTKIGVRLAHEDGLPNRDGFGNFFIADQEVEQ